MKGAPQMVRARAIKLATGELVSACGGQEAAASIIDKSQSHIQRCSSAHDEVNFLNLRDAALLEVHAGANQVTQLLCKLAGGVFLPLPDPALAGAEALPLKVIALAEELGDVSRAVRAAMRDGQTSKSELREIELQIDELIAKAVEARALVQVLRGVEPVVRAVAPRPAQR